MTEEVRAIADKYLLKLISRKLLVWVTATYALFSGFVEASEWIQVCLIYIGSQGAVDLISSYIRAKNGVE